MCPYAEHKKGTRTFSNNVPGFAQGAYFPGDEPGYVCNLTGEYCSACETDNLDECNYAKTAYYCPDCFCTGKKRVNYLFDLPQGMTCLECGREYTEKEWLDAINDDAEVINETFTDQKDKIRKLQARISYLEKELEKMKFQNMGLKYALSEI